MPCKKFNGTLHIFPVMLYFWNSLSSVGVVQKHICSTASLQQENRRFTSIGNNDSIVNNAFSPAPTMPHWVWPRCGRHFRAFKPTRASSDNRSFALCDNPTIATTLYNSSLLWIQFLLYPKIDNVVLPSGWQKLVATTTNFNIATKERSFKTKIFVRVQTFRRRLFVPSHDFCHPAYRLNAITYHLGQNYTSSSSSSYHPPPLRHQEAIKWPLVHLHRVGGGCPHS